jgi:predicted TPR repeat methyltransferase
MRSAGRYDERTSDPVLNMGAELSPLQAAIEAHKGGHLLEAEAAYRAILQLNPTDADALNFLGMLRCQSGDLPGGAQLLRAAVEALPGNAHAWVNLANVLVMTGATDEARTALTKATELAPDMAIAWFNLGVCLGRCRRPRDGAAALHKALTLEPGYIPAYKSLAMIYYRLGDYAQGAQVYREWLAQEPGNATAQHMLAATSGQATPTRADHRYIRETFDDFAASFDESLRLLDYRAPQLIAAALTEALGPTARLEVLDAGCGTGLCAALVRSIARRLVGVDLSASMVQRARERGLYDELVVAELCEFMRARPQSFEVIYSADTLVYFGALEEPLAAMCGSLYGAAMAAFTLEELESALPGESYRLQPHGRYTHSEAYVRNALLSCGFVRIAIARAVLRRELGRDVAGLVVQAWAA